MATILNFMRRPAGPAASDSAALAALMADFSIEVMPRTAAKIADFRALLPAGTRVYLAHIDGTPFDEMLATARRLRTRASRSCRISPPAASRAGPSSTRASGPMPTSACARRW